MGLSWVFMQKIDDKFTKWLPNHHGLLCWPVDSTRAWAYALKTLTLNTQGSRLYTYSHVRLGNVRGILCPSNTPSMPFLPNNRSKFEKYAPEVDRQCSQCVVFSLWVESPNMVVMWHDCAPRIAECGRKCPNPPNFYRIKRHLAWEIHTILNAQVATQNSTGHGIKNSLCMWHSMQRAKCDVWTWRASQRAAQMEFINFVSSWRGRRILAHYWDRKLTWLYIYCN